MRILSCLLLICIFLNTSCAKKITPVSEPMKQPRESVNASEILSPVTYHKLEIASTENQHYSNHQSYGARYAKPLYSMSHDKALSQEKAFKDNDEKAFKIVRDIYLSDPVFAIYEKFRGDEFILASVGIDLVVLKKFAETWQEHYRSKDAYISTSNTDTNNEVKGINGDVLLYILALNQGTSFGSATYKVYSLKDNRLYTIEASGYHGSYNDFTIPEELKINRTDILAYLEKKISRSKYTYIQSEKALDISLPQNSEKNWVISNPSIYESLSSTPNVWFQLNITKNHSKAMTDFFNNSSEQGTKFDFENDQYKIRSYFKGSVLAFDKKNKEYFALWVPDSTYSWVSDLKFLNPQMIILTDHSSDIYKIDLEKLRILRVTTKKVSDDIQSVVDRFRKGNYYEASKTTTGNIDRRVSAEILGITEKYRKGNY
jgi:hypothetical protein